MRYAQIRAYDVANGTGIRTSIFVSGCTHNCFNCFNLDYQRFNFGCIWDQNTTSYVIELLQRNQVKGLSILGGEPFQQCPYLTKIILDIKANICANKDIWIWSGYTYEQIISDANKLELLKLCDVLVDGKFIEKQKDLTLQFRGSANQRIIRISESLKQNKVVLYDL